MLSKEHFLQSHVFQLCNRGSNADRTLRTQPAPCLTGDRGDGGAAQGWASLLGGCAGLTSPCRHQECLKTETSAHSPRNIKMMYTHINRFITYALILQGKNQTN